MKCAIQKRANVRVLPLHALASVVCIAGGKAKGVRSLQYLDNP